MNVKIADILMSDREKDIITLLNLDPMLLWYHAFIRVPVFYQTVNLHSSESKLDLKALKKGQYHLIFTKKALNRLIEGNCV